MTGETVTVVMRVFYRYGAEAPQCNLIVCSGPKTTPMQRFVGGRVIRGNGLAFADIGVCFNGVFSEATDCRVLRVGQRHAARDSPHRLRCSPVNDRGAPAGASSEDVLAAASKHYVGSRFHGYMQE